jgi:hypothetical protein
VAPWWRRATTEKATAVGEEADDDIPLELDAALTRPRIRERRHGTEGEEALTPRRPVCCAGLGCTAPSPEPRATVAPPLGQPEEHNPTAQELVRARAPGPYHTADKPPPHHLLVHRRAHPQDSGQPATQALASGEPRATE